MTYRTHFFLLSQDGFVFDLQFEALDLASALLDIKEIYGEVTLIQWGVR